MIGGQVVRSGQRVVLVLSGGNIDLDLLAEIARTWAPFEG